MIDPSLIPNLVSGHFSGLSIVIDMFAWRQAGVLDQRLDEPESLRRLTDPHLISILELARITGAENELTLQGVRRWLLDVALRMNGPGSGGAQEWITTLVPFAQALALQCFYGDYVFYVSDAEQLSLSALREQIDRAKKIDALLCFQVVVFCCYEHLQHLKNRDLIPAYAEAHPDPLLDKLARMLIWEPRREEELRANIRRFGDIEDDTSKVVRAQYESNPYPRWTLPHVRQDDALDRAHMSLIDEIVDNPEPLILIAGCGTGKHPLSVATCYPHARVLAIDLSRSSLAYAMRRTEELGVRNLEFMQGDILQIDDLGLRFDAIECVGVLHHMRDPLLGWNQLNNVLKPGGWMRIGLYSATAHRSLRELRNRISAGLLDAGNESIRKYRWKILNGQDDPAHRLAANVYDFYNLNECRDLLFHVQEHLFTLPEIAAVLEGLDLDFVRFEFSNGTAFLNYRKYFPHDDAMINLEHWREVEERRPDTFSGMYQFWVRKRPDSDPLNHGERGQGKKPLLASRTPN